MQAHLRESKQRLPASHTNLKWPWNFSKTSSSKIMAISIVLVWFNGHSYIETSSPIPIRHPLYPHFVSQRPSAFMKLFELVLALWPHTASSLCLKYPSDCFLYGYLLHQSGFTKHPDFQGCCLPCCV